METLTNEQWEQKNKALSDQLDKVTDNMFKAQQIATDLKNQLEEKKHTEQLGAWAIDRALETAKLNLTKGEDIAKIAQTYCDWIKSSSAQVTQ